MKDRLFHLRKEVLNLSRNKFGEPIGMTDSEIKNIETGATVLKESKIPLICSHYNVNEDWLRNGTGEMFKPISAAEQVNRLMNEVIRTDGSESWQAARKTIIEALAEMPPEFWEQAAKLIDEIKNR